jgi:2',3'-cyclic-nucleotide 2'-phosphodiesterase (5'-nucleotidase family)
LKSLGPSRDYLLVDNGDILSPTEKYPFLAAELIAKSMDKMGYDCLNLGDLDLLYGEKVVQQVSEKTGLHLISTNILGDEVPWKRYLIKKVNSVRIGILGVVSPKLFKNSNVQVKDPKDTLLSILPTLRKKVDMVVLLLHMPLEDAKELLASVQGIDVAILGHGFRVLKPMKVHGVVVMGASFRGEYVGVLTVDWDSKERKITEFNGRLVNLSGDFKSDPDIEHIVKSYRKIAIDKERKKRAEERRREEEAKKLLKMTPEEFIGYMQKKHPERLLRREK